MPRKRVRIIVSEQLDPTAGASDLEFGLQRANWEMARRIGRSQSIALTCDSWRDTAGKLWTPNRLATVDVPNAYLNNLEWAIGTVTYRKDASGTHADVVLMPKEAFSVQPTTLYLYDREATQTPPASQNPTPGPGGMMGHV
jgi:prophage tail gpP-like protein